MTTSPRRDELAIFLSHPIQHFIPWLQALDCRLDGRLMVHYASRHGLEARYDPEFGESFAWEMDLLSGYRHTFWETDGTRGPGAGFRGIRYPGVDALFARNRPAAVLVWGWLFQGYWEAAWRAHRAGVPYLLRGESNLATRGGGARWWLKQQTVGRLCRGAGACLAIGTRNAELYREYGVPSERVWKAPYFVDNKWFRSESARLRGQRRDLRRHFGLPEDAFVLLFIGKLIEKKHPDHLLRAWQALPDDIRSKSAVFYAGSGTLAADLAKQARGNERVVFGGLMNRSQLPQAYVVSDALVLPSDSGETWGLVVNEAMASGIPAVVSDQVGSAPDLVVHGRTGLIFPFGDVPALTEQIFRLIQTPADAEAMGLAAQSHVESASLDRAVDATLSALASLQPRGAFN